MFPPPSVLVSSSSVPGKFNQSHGAASRHPDVLIGDPACRLPLRPLCRPATTPRRAKHHYMHPSYFPSHPASSHILHPAPPPSPRSLPQIVVLVLNASYHTLEALNYWCPYSQQHVMSAPPPPMLCLITPSNPPQPTQSHSPSPCPPLCLPRSFTPKYPIQPTHSHTGSASP